MQKYDVIIIGGGAAGLLAAGFAIRRGFKVAIIEKNERLARKVMITGKGRCNLTNNCDEEILISSLTKNNRFMYSAFKGFSSYDTMDLFENQLKVPLKTERGNRVFPKSDKAVDIVDALVKFSKDADVIHGNAEEILCRDKKVTGVKLKNKDEILADNILIATGGKSYPLTGSDGSGYLLAQMLGHTLVSPEPSLIPVETIESFCKEMMGLSLKNVKVSIKDKDTGKTVYSEMGEMLFTHFGVSGPLVLSGSAHMRPMSANRFCIHIDLKPALNELQLSKRIARDFSENINREFQNSLSKLLPKKMIPVIIRLSGISPEKRVNQITKEERAKLCKLIKDFTVTAKKFRPIEEAIITSGGIDVSEINPKTMESKIIKGLFFAGEVIDVDAYTGGFNLQIAFSTGYAAAEGFEF